MVQIELFIRLYRTMLDELKSMAVFCKVVECKSFAGAAKQLKLSPSVISHHISTLEQKTGVALLYRSTRKLSLTTEGAALYQSCAALVAAAEEGLGFLNQKTEQPQGELTICMAAVLVRSPLISAIADFSNKFRKINLTLLFSDTTQNFIEQGIDIGFRVGRLENSQLKSQLIYKIVRRLVVSPQLFNAFPRPKQLSDLSELPWINPFMLAASRIFIDKQGKQQKISFHSKIQVDNVDAACELVKAGAGVSSPPEYLVERLIEEGVLIELFSEYKLEPMNVYALWHSNSSKNSLCSLFKEHIIQYLQNTDFEQNTSLNKGNNHLEICK